MSYKRYWVALAIVIIGSFAVLGGVGRKMISEAPPILDVYSANGQLLFTGGSITTVKVSGNPSAANSQRSFGGPRGPVVRTVQAPTPPIRIIGPMNL
jgi:hypothetical protein